MRTMKVIRKNIIAVWVFLLSLAVLLFNTQSIPHQGQSSFILFQKLGLDPLPVFVSPVYGWIVKAISLVSGSSVILAVNAFSALCGAGVMALVFLFVYRFVRIYNVEKTFAPPAMHRIQLFSGLISVLYLLASSPFSLAATRANSITFDLLLMLVPFYLALSSSKENGSLRLPLSTLLYGVAIVEFNTAVLLAPVFGVLVLSKMWVANTFTLKDISKVFAAGFLGLSVYLIQAGLYTTTPAYVWREFNSLLEVFWLIWVEQYIGLTKTLPRVGWLALGLVSVLPWVITSFMRLSRKTSNNSGATIGIGSLNLMLGVLAVLLTLDDFPLAPVSITGTKRLFVTPYLMISMWVGSVGAFWAVLLFRSKRFEKPALEKLRHGAGVTLIAAVPIYLLVEIATSSMPATFSQDDALAHQFAENVVDVSEEKEWLITSTPFDDQIALESYRRGLPLKVLRLSYGRSAVYMKHVAGLFSDTPRLESLASIGMGPLIDEWFAEDPDVDKKVSVVHVPDVWLIAGMEAVPDRLVFSGAKAGMNLSLDSILNVNKTFWGGFGDEVIELVSRDETLGLATSWISVHLSKIANNLGVFLEDNGRDQDAYDCYMKSREFAPENLSALMNLHVLSGRLELPDHEAYEKELVQRTEKLMGRVQTWTLSYVYGFVRVPELFANRGMAFAMSGKANMAITDMKRALTLKNDNPEVQMALADLYFSQEKDVESREYYSNVLETNPNNAPAILGLMRVSVRQGNLDDARRHLVRLKELNYDPDALVLEEAVLEAFDGAPSKAMRLLQGLVKSNPNHMKAWAAIAVTAAQLNDTVTGEEAIQRLRNANILSPNIQIVMAQSALDNKDRDGARQYLNDILRQQPANVRALEMLLRIHVSEGNEDAVQDAVERLLKHDPSNALGNYMLGVHHYYNEEYELAESAYRASLATRRLPETLNDIAYVLTVQGELEEAEVLIRESLDLKNNNGAAWDTLGVILMKKGQLEEAEEALVHSLGLRPEAATVMLSLALLYEKQEKWAESKELISEIGIYINELPSPDQQSLSALQQRMDDRR